MRSLPSQLWAVENNTRNDSEEFQAFFHHFSLVWVIGSALVSAQVNQGEILALKCLGCGFLDVKQVGA